MKRSTLLILTSVMLLVLLFAGGGDQQQVGAQFGASFNPHGNYSASTSSCTTCHQLHAQSVSTETACYNCHPSIQTHKAQACAICHDPHAQTNNSALVQQSIWSRTVRFNGQSFDNNTNGVCVACHTTTRYHGSSATATHYETQDCTKCHPHQSGFRVDPQGCTSCHGEPPASGAHARHEQADIGATNCSTCHQTVRNYTDPGHYNGWVNFKDGKGLAATGVCTDCHGNASGIAEAKSAWKSNSHINDCTGCHNSAAPSIVGGRVAPAVDAFWQSNGHGQGHAQDRDLDCQACHNPASKHFDSTNARLWDAPDTLCARCHADSARAGADVSTHGNLDFDIASQAPFSQSCSACHNPHGSSNLAAIRSTVAGNSVVFTARSGNNSFDEADDNNSDDLCATCHTTTAHNRQPSNRSQLPHNEGQDCSTCHSHNADGDPTTVDGFMPAGGCSGCHAVAVDNGDNVPPGGRPAVVGAFSLNSHHLSGDLSDEKCAVCHDQSRHGNGYVDLRMPDGGAGLRFIQVAGVDLTPFCQACHDANGSQIAVAPGGSSADPFAEGDDLLALDVSGTHSNLDFQNAQEGPFRKLCNDCHVGHGSSNLAMISPAINGNSITFLARTGSNSFDDPAKADNSDLCATCHVGNTSLHAGGDHRPAGGEDLRGQDCTLCHRHDVDDNLLTQDGFMASCTACHGQPPPAAAPGYALNENLTPHQKHAGTDPGEYGIACMACHNSDAPGYSGHITQPASFQDVFFDALNPGGSYNPAASTCAGVGCHSNGSPSTGAVVFKNPVWAANSRLDCSGCHQDQFNLNTGSHAKHLTANYRDRGADAIGCFECHAETAFDGHNDVVANTATHVDFQKQVRFDTSDIWGGRDTTTFNSGALTCTNSLCHSDGVASREQPGTPKFSTPKWGDAASGACGSCHAVVPAQLQTGAHARHFDTSNQGPGITNCLACHSAYDSQNHVNGQVNFNDGQTLSQTNACNACHSPGGAVNGVVEARANWRTGKAVGCEGCHDSEPSIIKGATAPDIAGDGVSYGIAVNGHGAPPVNAVCSWCHQKNASSIHFDGVANTYSAAADNFAQTRWLTMGGLNIPLTAGEVYQRNDYAQCLTCHQEANVVGMGPGYSNALFTHSNPPPGGYPLNVADVVTRFRNENAAGLNFGNVPANIHWDHLDMNQQNWDSDGDGKFDSKPSCVTCHDPHGVKSHAGGVNYPAMTYADMGITYGADAIGAYGQITNSAYGARCIHCHSSSGTRYYRP